MALVANDTIGANNIIEEEGVIALILQAMHDSSSEVRGNVYTCMQHVSRTTAGASACVQAGVCDALAAVMAQEDEALQCVLLQCVYNMASLEKGLAEALNHDVIKLCIQYLTSKNAVLRSEAARTLGLLCFSERGKNTAVENCAVPALMNLLSWYKDDMSMLLQASLALMAVTSADEGKRQMNTITNAVEIVVSLLFVPLKVINLNGIKIISNIAVHPVLRNQLKKHEDCVGLLKKLSEGEDHFTAKHAKIALDGVMWKA